MSASAQQYLALVFAPDWVSAAIWQPQASQINLLTRSRLVSVKSDKSAELNAAVDTVLDDLGEAGLSLKNVLFVVSHLWLEKNDIQEDKKRFLKTITQDLLLEPMGFVVITDTLAAQQQDEHGQAFSGTFIYDSALYWDIVLYEEGSEKNHDRIGKSGELNADIAELQARLSGDGADRLILLPQPNAASEEVVAAFHQAWPEKVEIILPEKAVEYAITLGGQEVWQSLDRNASPVATSATNTSSPETNGEPQTDHDFTPPVFLNPATSDSPLINPSPSIATPTIHNNIEALSDEEHETAVDLLNAAGIDTTSRSRWHFSWPKWSFRVPLVFRKSGPRPLVWGVLAVVALLLLIMGGAMAWLRTNYTTDITVWVKSDKLEIAQTFVLGTDNTIEASGSPVLVAETFTDTVTTNKEVPATGTKIIGDKAKGQVVILNKTDQEKEFPAGTVIRSNNQDFLLDEGVKVASSSEEGRVRKYGESKVNVTAKNFGPEGNLEKKQTFTVANFDNSSYSAENDDSFSGGAKREIQAVAQKDVDTAVKDLQNAAKTQLADKILQNKNGDETVLFPDKIKVTAVNTSVKVGEEAKFVNVSITAEGVGIRISPDVIANAAQTVLAEKLQDQEILPGSVSLTPSSVATRTDGTYELQATLAARTATTLSPTDVHALIAGQYYERAPVLLQETGKVARSEINFKPALASFLFTAIPQDMFRTNINIRLENEP